MSELQLSLLAIGVLVVGGVYGYNAWQERRLRQRLHEAFDEERGDDALMRMEVVPTPRSEPQLKVEPQLAVSHEPVAEDVAPEPVASPVTLPVEEPAAAPAVERPVPPVPWFDEVLDYVAEILAPAPPGSAVIAELTAKIAAGGKPARVAGFNPITGEWEDLKRVGAGHHSRIRLALQLVTRSGPLSAPQVAGFTDAIRACATKIGATADYPDARAALQQAREVDEFCAEVDIAIGLNVVAPSGANFSGRDIQALAEAGGFKLEADGLFHYRQGGRTVFTLDNHEPVPFDGDDIASVTTSGVTLVLDVPRALDGKRALDLMIDAGERLATGLGGRLVDDNRVPLSATGITRIRQQLDAIADAMVARGFTPGGERALRLFA